MCPAPAPRTTGLASADRPACSAASPAACMPQNGLMAGPAPCRATGGLIVLGALALWLGFPNDLAPAWATAMAVLLWPVCLGILGLHAPSAAAALRRGWLSSFLGQAAVLYWLALPVHEVGGLPLPLAAAVVLFVPVVLSSAGGLFSLAAYLWRRRPPLMLAVMLGLVWYLLEYVYALVAGFPWLPLTAALAALPLSVQAADMLGSYALSGVWVTAVLLAVFSLPHILPSDSNTARAPHGTAVQLRPLLAGMVLLVALGGYGTWRLQSQPLETTPHGPDSFALVAVDGSVDQNQKWDPAFQHYNLNLYLGLSREALAHAPAPLPPLTPSQAPTALSSRHEAAPHQHTEQTAAQSPPAAERPLIIWPETALPFFYGLQPSLSKPVTDFAVESACPLLFGAPGAERKRDRQGASLYNRAFLLSPQGRLLGFHDKEHLVPFGEYLPQWLDWPFLEALLQNVGVYDKGTVVRPLRHENLALGMLICYEGIFPWLTKKRAAQGANVLVDISNDGWFGRTPALRQHLYLKALRALEQNRWMIRSTNAGISGVLDARGRATVLGEPYHTPYLWARAKTVREHSLYFYLAPYLPWAAALVLAVLSCLGLRRKRA